ncbi:MAG: sulfide/dihydroorotate dehydrogenase-like FAD/NAD-binding protein [Candidatus Bathyarchaeota archaeon]
MHKIIKKEKLAPQINLFEFSAKEIAMKTEPGQFVILRIDEEGERIPLTITSINVKDGTISVVCHEVGKSTKKLGRLREGDHIIDILGPLGKPAEIKKFGTVLCIGGGVMVAPLHFQAEALRKAGNHVIGIIGARTGSHIIFEEAMRDACNELYVATDDGTKGYQGLDFLKPILKDRQIDRVIVMGPVITMKIVSDMTRSHGIKTIVNLIPLMVDGMGMCGACRVTVGDNVMFACVDGPDFDGHFVDFNELATRLKMFTPQEKLAYVFYEEGKEEHD